MVRRFLAPALSVLCLVLVCVCLFCLFVLQSSWQDVPLLAADVNDPRDQKHAQHNVVMQGDYLLGVGKADITG